MSGEQKQVPSGACFLILRTRFLSFQRQSDNALTIDDILFESYKEFQEENEGKNTSEEMLKAEFTKQTLTAFYAIMDYIFRDGFGTGSHTAKRVVSELKSILFGKE